MWKIEVLCVQSGSTLNVVLRWETSRSLSWCPAPRTPAAPPPLPAAAAAAPAGRVSIGDILAGPPVALPPLHPVTHARPAALPVTRPVPLDAAPCASLADSRRRGEPPGVGDPCPHPSRGPSLPPALCPAPKTFLPHLSSRPGTFHPLLPAPGTLSRSRPGNTAHCLGKFPRLGPAAPTPLVPGTRHPAAPRGFPTPELGPLPPRRREACPRTPSTSAPRPPRETPGPELQPGRLRRESAPPPRPAPSAPPRKFS